MQNKHERPQLIRKILQYFSVKKEELLETFHVLILKEILHSFLKDKKI